MKNLFIDANIWLSLYLYDKKTLNNFESLKELFSKINLIVPRQVYDEVLRNRDGKINGAWNDFSKKVFNDNAPSFCRDYPEYKDYIKLHNDMKDKYKELKDAVNCDIRKHKLKADLILADIFNGIEFIKSTPEIIRQAELRYKSGNPPGKEGSLGDAINWELLLQNVHDREDLYLISGDEDYSSTLNKKVINGFLEKEWTEKKHSNIYFFTTLQDFLDNYANTQLLQPESSDSDKNKSEDSKLRDSVLRISKAMKDEMARIEKERQNDYYRKSIIYSILSKRNPSIDLFIKYLTLTNNIQAEINKRDIIQPKDEESSLISSIDNLEIDQAGEEDCSLSVKDDSSPEQHEKDCSQTPTDDPDNSNKHDDKEDTQTLDGQDNDQKQDEGDDDVIQ